MQLKGFSVKELFEETRELLSLELLNEILESPLQITLPDIHRPGLALTGFMQNYLNERIQVLGETEILFINTRTEKDRRRAVENLFSVPLVCIIVTRGLEVPPDLTKYASEHGVPLLRSKMLTTPFIHELTKFLDARGRILSRRKTRVSAKIQRRAAKAIKRARHLALLPYTGDHTRITRKHR